MHRKDFASTWASESTGRSALLAWLAETRNATAAHRATTTDVEHRRDRVRTSHVLILFPHLLGRVSPFTGTRKYFASVSRRPKRQSWCRTPRNAHVAKPGYHRIFRHRRLASGATAQASWCQRASRCQSIGSLPGPRARLRSRPMLNTASTPKGLSLRGKDPVLGLHEMR